LRALDTVVRTGSFSLAARDIGLSQPSLSNHVRALEQAYGLRLLDRSGPKVTATSELEALLPEVRALLALADSLDARMSRVRDAETGNLRVGYSTYQIAMPILSRFLDVAPGISLEARAAASGDLLELLEASEIDIGLITAREPPAGLSAAHVLSTRIVLAVPPGHPLLAEAPLRWPDVAGLPLIQRERTSGTRQIFEAAATLARTPLTTRLVLGSWGSIAEMVRAGAGAGVALEAEIRPDSGVVPLAIDDALLRAGHYLVCLPELEYLAAVSRLMGLVRREGNSLVSAARV
jgi:DNA-binding transcriptional LysR family regulator